MAGQGKARVTRLAYCGSFPQRVNVMARQGLAWHGLAWHGMAWQGKGASAHGGGSANRQGWARHGEAGHGVAWRGVSFSNINEGLNYDFSGRHDKAKAG
jgi:hypothetical protein